MIKSGPGGACRFYKPLLTIGDGESRFGHPHLVARAMSRTNPIPLLRLKVRKLSPWRASL